LAQLPSREILLAQVFAGCRLHRWLGNVLNGSKKLGLCLGCHQTTKRAGVNHNYLIKLSGRSKNGQEQIMEAIKKMTVLELAELVKELEEEFGVSAAAPVAMAAVPAAGVGVEAEEEEPDGV